MIDNLHRCDTMYYTRGRKRAIHMSTSIRMTEREQELVKSYAKIHGISVGEAFKRALFEKIEDEFDIAEAELAYDEFSKDSKTYSLDEVKEMLKIG